MKTVLFIFREFNDIDHMIPIIYKSLQLNKYNVIVSCINPNFNIMKDFRLNYIKNKFGIDIKYIHQLHVPSIMHWVFLILVFKLTRIKFLNSFPLLSLISAKLKQIAFNSSIRKRLYNQTWVERLCVSHNVDAILVDFGSIEKFIYQEIKSAADLLSLPMIGVPHGYDTTANDFWTNSEQVTQDSNRMEKSWGWVDNLIVASAGVKTKYANLGLKENKIKVIGSARFCKEWSPIYFSMLGDNPLMHNKTNHLKIVFFDHSTMYRSNPDAIFDTLLEIDNLPFVDLVIKPHTRMNLSDYRFYDIGTISNEHSTHLIASSDVVINYMSSIVIDAYYFNKIFIYPDYFNQNIMRWELYNACWTVKSKSEMISALTNIYNKASATPYGTNEINHFLTQEIHGGTENADVLSNYVEHISNVAMGQTY